MNKSQLRKLKKSAENKSQIIPADYKKLISITNMYEEQGLSREEAQIEAFYECTGNK